MNASRKLIVLMAATLVALALVAGPAFAVDEPADEAETEAQAEDEGGRIAIADSPRDRLGLIFLGALVFAGGLSLANARRQLKGERPSASGEFRWR